MTNRFALIVGLAWLMCQPLQAYEIFVSPQGKDEWSGKLAEPKADQSDGPVASLTKARDLMRGYLRRTAGSGSEPVYITLRAGTYRLSDTLQLGTADSGSENAPVIYRAYQAEQPIISGGVEVTEFKPDGPGIYRAQLPEQVTDPAQIRMVLQKGTRLPMARWPNYDSKNPIAGGWAYVDGKRPSKPSETVAGETEDSRKKLRISKTDQRRWQKPEEGELFIFARFNYWNDLVPIESYDATSGQLSTKTACSYAIRAGDRYFVQGHREELDAPGEWYIDRQAREILIYRDAADAKLTLELAIAPTLIGTRQGAKHIRLEKLTFTTCNATALNFIDADNIHVTDCRLEHVGDLEGHAVAFQGGQGNRVSGCEIVDVGASGVFISGGEEKTLQAAGHVAENNHIHHTGVINKHTAGVWLSGIGNSAIKNSIHDCPRMGVMMPFSGPNARNTVEFNHIHHVNLETQDTGAVYASGREWIAGRGTVIRHNFIHDSLGFGWNGQKWATPYYAWGIYLDDACSSSEIVGNIVARSSRGSLMIHSGQYNRIENNIFVDGGEQQIELRGWEARYSYWRSLMPAMEKRYNNVKDEAAWQDFKLVPPAQADNGTGKLLIGNTFKNNIIVYKGRDILYMDVVNLGTPFDCNNNLIFARGTPPKVHVDEKMDMTFDQWKAQGLDTQSRQGDPKFKDPANDDYTLDANSPALRMGFKPIPFEKIAK